MGSNKTLLFSLPSDKLNDGINFIDGGRLIVFKAESGALRASRNRCRHQQGTFKRSKDCILTCAQHGWRLDASTMRYVHPAGALQQPELFAEVNSDGVVSIYEASRALPWETDPRSPVDINQGDLQVRFYSHACVEIIFGGESFFTDPWLIGPAFSRGWWLVHEPPTDWRSRIAQSRGIYISHNHSDHLNAHTLLEIWAINPEIAIYIPSFESDSCRSAVHNLGFKNVIAAEFGEWMNLSCDARFMILPDGSGRDDSGLLFEYKGHRILNTVDCSNLNGGELPSATMLLTAFAGGATGYPVCWQDLYSEDWIDAFIDQKLRVFAQHVVNHARRIHPKVFVPFAGYFTEAHPSDAAIRRSNRKNSPGEVWELVRQAVPDAQGWLPCAGDVFDVATLEVVEKHEFQRHQDYAFEKYVNEIRESLAFEPLASLDGFQVYFSWAGFRADDLVLHIVETDDDFSEAINEFYVDFNGPTVSTIRPDRPHRYERLRVRTDVFRDVLRFGRPWEEISIGFQARFFRSPDIYNFDFWNHFQNLLPLSPPWPRPDSLS